MPNGDDVRASFVGPADGYDSLMGRYLPELAPKFADAAEVGPGLRVLDVGCGPGGLTGELVARVGAEAVAAIDPSPPFVAACRLRHVGADVRVAVAEELPFADATFDRALSSLVLGLLTDPAIAVREMVRVTRPGGVVAACFWDQQRMPLLNVFSSSATEVDPSRPGELERIGSRPGDLTGLLQGAGLRDVHESALSTAANYRDFDDWWSPFLAGIGPAGAFIQSLDEERREVVRQACWQRLGRPTGRFGLTAFAWSAHGTVE